MKYVATMLACLLPLCAGAQSRHLNRPTELDTVNIGSSDVFQAIYHGLYDQVRDKVRTTRNFSYVFRHSVMAWSWHCSAHVGEGATSITMTATPTDQWGNAVRVGEHKTYKIPKRYAKKIAEYGGLTFEFPYEYGELIERNGCTSRATQKYLDNLLRYANGLPPA
jgi:hypothetical protein